MSVPKKDGGVVTLHLRDARVLVRLEVLVELLVVADEDEAVARDEDRLRVILEVVDQVRTAGPRPVVLCARTSRRRREVVIGGRLGVSAFLHFDAFRCGLRHDNLEVEGPRDDERDR